MKCKNVKKRVKTKYFGFVTSVRRRFNKTIKLAKKKIRNSYNDFMLGKTKKINN